MFIIVRLLFIVYPLNVTKCEKIQKLLCSMVMWWYGCTRTKIDWKPDRIRIALDLLISTADYCRLWFLKKGIYSVVRKYFRGSLRVSSEWWRQEGYYAPAVHWNHFQLMDWASLLWIIPIIIIKIIHNNYYYFASAFSKYSFSCSMLQIIITVYCSLFFPHQFAVPKI